MDSETLLIEKIPSLGKGLVIFRTFRIQRRADIKVKRILTRELKIENRYKGKEA